MDMYRRIVFIAVLPVLGSGSFCATVGCFFAIVFVAVAREVAPFVNSSTNVVMLVAQYQILGTFLGALILFSGSFESVGLSGLAMGALLLVINVVILALVAWLCVARWRLEKAAKKWRRALTSQ